MSTQQDKELLTLTLTGPAARPHTFLSLAPATSAPIKTAAIVTPPTEEELLEAKARRSSSMSSTGSLGQKRRFLKLGTGEGDWSEEVIE